MIQKIIEKTAGKHFLPGVHRGDIVLILFLSAFSLLLLFLPTGFESGVFDNARRAKVKVLETDDSMVQQLGITKHGNQALRVRVLRGPFRGEEFEADNMLMGKLELDSVYAPGDRALAVMDLHPEDGRLLYISVIGHYRLDIQLFLLALFVIFLLLFAGWTGAKALFSFLFSALSIWKVLIPLVLKGADPLLVSGALVLSLTGIIIFLVGGFGRKGVTAFLGAASGIMLTALLSLLFGAAFKIHGAVRPFSESLLYSGYAHLDLTRLFYASVFIAASGAVMDLAMDIASAMHEIHEKHPALHRAELVKSGFAVGRAVVGTMTTTLLFAYSGGYITLLMVFMAQGIPVQNMLNLSYVSAEILSTLVGSFGLVTVAPFTAVIGGFLYGRASGDAAGAKQAANG